MIHPEYQNVTASGLQVQLSDVKVQLYKIASYQHSWQSPPYAIPYGCWIPNPIYEYGYGVGIMRLIRKVADMRSEIGESGSEKV